MVHTITTDNCWSCWICTATVRTWTSPGFFRIRGYTNNDPGYLLREPHNPFALFSVIYKRDAVYELKSCKATKAALPEIAFALPPWSCYNSNGTNLTAVSQNNQPCTMNKYSSLPWLQISLGNKDKLWNWGLSLVCTNWSSDKNLCEGV